MSQRGVLSRKRTHSNDLELPIEVRDLKIKLQWLIDKWDIPQDHPLQNHTRDTIIAFSEVLDNLKLPWKLWRLQLYLNIRVLLAIISATKHLHLNWGTKYCSHPDLTMEDFLQHRDLDWDPFSLSKNRGIGMEAVLQNFPGTALVNAMVYHCGHQRRLLKLRVKLFRDLNNRYRLALKETLECQISEDLKHEINHLDRYYKIYTDENSELPTKLFFYNSDIGESGASAHGFPIFLSEGN